MNDIYYLLYIGMFVKKRGWNTPMIYLMGGITYQYTQYMGV